MTAPAATAAPDLTTAAAAQAELGREVAITGSAGNAKLGAIVQIADLVVYCAGMDRWPAGIDNGTRIRVRGKLEQTDEFETAGGYMQGTGGPIFRIHNCTYEKR